LTPVNDLMIFEKRATARASISHRTFQTKPSWSRLSPMAIILGQGIGHCRQNMPIREKRIPIQRSDYNVVDREFDSMRERFEVEMRRVEEEMARLRREFEGYTPKMSPTGRTEPDAFFPSPGVDHAPALKRYDPYLESINSPLIKDESDGKTLRLRFDVSQYKPEEVNVKTVDNRLLVHAKHEEKSQQRTVYREYNQEFMLPRGTDAELITSTLSVDGILTVQAPLPAVEAPPPSGRRVPITHN
ncbi:Protein lethal(2)essential for life, partial [Trichinella zimbabwensis]